MHIKIKLGLSETIIFEGDYESTKAAVVDAVSRGANLEGANLEGAYLVGANLEGAYLVGANLEGAYLGGANLEGAYLVGAYLRDANLRGAYLGGANLGGAYLRDANLRGAYLGGANLEGAYLRDAKLIGAYLRDAKLVGERPIFCMGPIGSRGAYLTIYLTDSGPVIKTGCFTGSLDEFISKVTATHGDNNHAKEYEAAVEFIKVNSELWGVK